MRVSVIIPAFNEEKSIPYVLNDIPNFVNQVVVCDNSSTDKTSEIAKNFGAKVVYEKKRGYGNACLKAITYLKNLKEKPEIVVFIDGDYSDDPKEMKKIIDPIVNEGYDFVLGARTKKLRDKHSMTAHQIFGNWLACLLMKIFFNSTFKDLGPFRAITWDKLLKLNMRDKTFGWTIEMQIKALMKNYKYKEIDVKYKKRLGKSKISGTLKGSILAGKKILYLIFKYYFKKKVGLLW